MGGRLGPGTLVLVVGPSGAGKDTLIERARQAFLDQPSLHFARRIVTRPASASEDHDSLAPGEFERARQNGRFALCWRAHGLDYAVPAEIDAVIAAGGTVVCNLSRGAVAAARQRYARVRVLFVDAPLAVRMARVATRGRRSEASERAKRETDFARADGDAVIDNDGAIESASDAFAVLLNRWRAASDLTAP